MNIFETVKAAVTVRQAAEHYGLKINRSGMICCPFHDDRHPSLKLNEDYFSPIIFRLKNPRAAPMQIIRNSVTIYGIR